MKTITKYILLIAAIATSFYAGREYQWRVIVQRSGLSMTEFTKAMPDLVVLAKSAKDDLRQEMALLHSLQLYYVTLLNNNQIDTLKVHLNESLRAYAATPIDTNSFPAYFLEPYLKMRSQIDAYTEGTNTIPQKAAQHAPPEGREEASRP